MKKKQLMTVAMIALLLIGTHRGTAQGLAINTSSAAVDPSAMLDVSATTKGVLVPRMDSAQRAAISSPATGLLVYQTDGATPGFYNYAGSTWQKVGATVQPHVQIYSAPGTYTFTTSSNITAATVFKTTMLGGGGGGGGGPGSGTGGGGGASAYTVSWGSGFSPNTAYTVIVGVGGTGGAEGADAGVGGAGGNGGPSSAMGVSCPGGSGGGGGSSNTPGHGGNGGGTLFGPSGGTLVSVGAAGMQGGAGGSSAFGAGGGVFGLATTGYGSGGGGNFGDQAGGSGAPGIVIIEWSE